MTDRILVFSHILDGFSPAYAAELRERLTVYFSEAERRQILRELKKEFVETFTPLFETPRPLPN